MWRFLLLLLFVCLLPMRFVGAGLRLFSTIFSWLCVCVNMCVCVGRGLVGETETEVSVSVSDWVVRRGRVWVRTRACACAIIMAII